MSGGKRKRHALLAPGQKQPLCGTGMQYPAMWPRMKYAVCAGEVTCLRCLGMLLLKALEEVRTT